MADEANSSSGGNVLRNVPSVDRVLAEPVLADMLARVKRDMVVDAVRDELAEVRRSLAGDGEAPSTVAVAASGA